MSFGVLMVIGLSIDSGHNSRTVTTTHASSNLATNESATPAIPASKWQYQQEEDKMRNAVSHYASLESENTVEFDFPYSGGSSASILLRNSPKYGKDIMLQISKGQFLCHVDQCSVSVKFDNHPVQSFSVSEPSDGSANVLFLSDKGRFLASLRKAKTVVIEAQFYQEGSRQFQFSPAGLEWQ